MTKQPMTIDKQALRDIAESIEREEWEVLDNGDDEYQVIVKGSLEKGETYRSYQPVSNEISERKIAAFIAEFSPATALALLDELEALQSFRTAYMEWSDKTDWVQTDKRFDVIKPWGKHRADVLKLYIDHLESKLEAAEKQNALDVQIKARLCGESNSLHDRLREAEKRIAEQREYYEGVIADGSKRIAELEARTLTVKLPDIMPPEAAPAHYWNTGESMAYADGYNKSTADLKTSFAQACSSAGVNVEFE